MTEYRVFETDEFRKRLEALDSRQRSLIKAKLKKFVYPQLRVRPHTGRNIKKLRSYQPETWRYRIGQLRIFYGIDDANAIVNILTLSDRKDAYR